MSPTLSRLGITLAPVSPLLACASGGMTNEATVITAPELSQSRATNVYDAIRRVRPEILRTRESGTVMFFEAGRPAVAVDDSLAGGVGVLRTIPVDQVARIEYLSPWEAEEIRVGFRTGPRARLDPNRRPTEPGQSPMRVPA